MDFKEHMEWFERKFPDKDSINDDYYGYFQEGASRFERNVKRDPDNAIMLFEYVLVNGYANCRNDWAFYSYLFKSLVRSYDNVVCRYKIPDAFRKSLDKLMMRLEGASNKHMGYISCLYYKALLEENADMKQIRRYASLTAKHMIDYCKYFSSDKFDKYEVASSFLIWAGLYNDGLKVVGQYEPFAMMSEKDRIETIKSICNKQDAVNFTLRVPKFEIY